MRSVNKVILVGYLAADPEAFTNQSGRTRVTFPVATQRDTTSDVVRKDVTDFHRVVAWDKLGDICATYLTRGQAVYVEGEILNRAYEKGDERKFVTEIRAEEINMLSWRKHDGVSPITIKNPTAGA